MTVTFLLVPVMLLYLGATGFGVWTIARVFVSYASLSDFGLSTTITKFVAEYQAKKDPEQLARVLSAALLLYMLIAAVILLLVWAMQELLVGLFFASSGPYARDVHFVMMGSMIIFAASLVGSVFSSALNGLQRMDLTNAVIAVYWLVNGILMYLALLYGYGLRGIIYANASAATLSILLNGFFFFRHFAPVPISLFRSRLDDLRASLRYGKDIFVISIANSVHLHYDKLLLGSFVSLGAVANYEVASRVIQLMRQVIVLLLNPLVPVASELDAHKREESIKRLYLRSMKYLVVFCVPFFVCIGAFADELLSLWLGEYDALILLTLQVLLIPNFINLMTGPAYFISIGIGRARLGMYSSVLGLLLNLGFSFLFLRLIGYVGLLAGTFLSLTVEASLFLYLIHRSLNVEWGRFFALFIRPLISTVTALLVGFAVGFLTEILLIKTFLMIGVTLGLYVLFMFRQQYFDAEDRIFIRDLKGRVLAKWTVASD